MKWSKIYSLILFGVCVCISSCGNEDDGSTPNEVVLQLSGGWVGPYKLNLTESAENTEAPADKPLVFTFTSPLDRETVPQSVELKNSEGTPVNLIFSYLDDDKTFSAIADPALRGNEVYSLDIKSSLRGVNSEKFPGLTLSFSTLPGQLEVVSLTIDDIEFSQEERITDISFHPEIVLTFSKSLDIETVTASAFAISGPNGNVPVEILLVEESTVVFSPVEALRGLRRYQLYLTGAIKGMDEELSQPQILKFYTAPDPTPVFPVITDDELLTLVQRETFKYFYDFAHPASCMARERNTSGDVVTTGGTGFGLMTIIVGIERNFITRQQGIDHFTKVISFLETAGRFHGVWPHWLNGNTGSVQPFSTKDNGGDLVETSFLVQGLLTVRQYLNAADATEAALISRINTLWEGVEWNWHTKGGENVLYWHWSPNYEWEMNHQIRGYNEALITYFLATASPTFPIDAAAYHQGWANNGSIKNGKSYYGIQLPLGFDYGGPLFFAHYSFLGLDPNGLTDTYGNYWEQNVAHSRINQAYAIANPKNFVGYSEMNWGLTASDNHQGYNAHSPTNDLGVITPTAALSSFPYTPEESMKALKFFYYTMGDRLWGDYGFYDAFNLTEGWTANSYLAIDQGPIVVMIENHRTGLLWDLFMSAPEVQTGMEKLGFSSAR